MENNPSGKADSGLISTGLFRIYEQHLLFHPQYMSQPLHLPLGLRCFIILISFIKKGDPSIDVFWMLFDLPSFKFIVLHNSHADFTALHQLLTGLLFFCHPCYRPVRQYL